MVRRVGLRREQQIPNSIGWTLATSPRRLLLWNQWNQTMLLKPQERFSSTLANIQTLMHTNTHTHTHTTWHKCISFSLSPASGSLPSLCSPCPFSFWVALYLMLATKREPEIIQWSTSRLSLLLPVAVAVDICSLCERWWPPTKGSWVTLYCWGAAWYSSLNTQTHTHTHVHTDM